MLSPMKSHVIEGPRKLATILSLAWGLSILGSMGGFDLAVGQVHTISGGPSCDHCFIERHLLATIHDSTFEGGAIGDGAAKPHVNFDGTFLIIAGPSVFSREIFFAGRDGAIAHSVGRKGEGPGEYRNPMHVMESDSFFLVVDPGLGRITYLHKPSLDFDRTVRIPGRITGVTPVSFSDGSYVMWASIGTREAAGYGLHHVSSDGQILRSFGPPPRGSVHALSASGDTAVWIGFDDYRIEKWDIEGILLSALIREAEWVKPEVSSTEPGDWVTWLTGLWEDRDGLLWAHTAGRKKRSAPAIGVELDPRDVESIVEVLDPVALTVVAQSRMPGRRDLAVPGSGFYSAGRRSTTEGLVLTDVWAYRLLSSSSPFP